MSRQELSLSVCITCSTGGEHGRHWRMTFTDQASGVRVFEAHLTMEQMGQALSAQLIEGVTGYLIDSPGRELVGRQREVGIVKVDVGGAWGDECLAAVEASPEMAKARADGWEPSGRELESFNHHRKTGHVYSVTMCRWAARDGDPRRPYRHMSDAEFGVLVERLRCKAHEAELEPAGEVE